jgi:hypothetical protein
MNTAEKTPSVVELMARIETLTAQVEDLKKGSKATNKSDRDMTDDDARRILTGDLKDKKHNEAALALNLSYGQVYSCRGEYTFRHIHKELKARPEGFKNPWKKA